MFGGKGGLGGLMKQAQQMQEKSRRCRKRSLSWKSRVNPVPVWSR